MDPAWDPTSLSLVTGWLMGGASSHHRPQTRKDNQCRGEEAAGSHRKERASESEKRVQSWLPVKLGRSLNLSEPVASTEKQW